MDLKNKNKKEESHQKFPNPFYVSNPVCIRNIPVNIGEQTFGKVSSRKLLNERHPLSGYLSGEGVKREYVFIDRTLPRCSLVYHRGRRGGTRDYTNNRSIRAYGDVQISDKS